MPRHIHIRFMHRIRRRPGRRPRWRPLGRLNDHELFIVSIVTVNPGMNRKDLRQVYFEDCELTGISPVSHRVFNRYVGGLLARGLIRRGWPSTGEDKDLLYPAEKARKAFR